MKRMVQLFTLLACLHGAAAWPGGTAVTNGRQVYNSPSGLSVSFGEPLSLKVISQVSFRITNEKLVQQSETPSEITFVVNQKKVGSVEEVEQLLAAEFPAKVIRPVEQPGAKGFFWEERSTSTLKARYDFLTSNGDFVEISVNANVAGDGISWIAPIVRSFTYDVTPPTVHALRTDGPEWVAGTVNKLYLKITDDYSGLKGLGSVRFDLIGEDGKRFEEFPRFFINEEPKAEGGDWYSLSYKVPAFLPEGTYVLSTIYAEDNATNSSSVVADTQDPARFYEGYPKSSVAPHLAVLKIKVRNPSGKVDLDAPELLGFRPDSSAWEAGSTHRVHFKIRDNLSGFNPLGSFSVIGPLVLVNEDRTRFYEMRAQNARPQSAGGDWYYADFTVPPNQLAGRYMIGNVMLEDFALNHSNQWFGREVKEVEPGLVSSFAVTITNRNPQDITPPHVLDWRLESEVWHPGETQIVHVKIDDDISGFDRVGWLSFKGSENELRAPGPTIQSEGNGWYAIPLKVDPYAKAGDYEIATLSMTDKVDNEVSYWCKQGQCSSHFTKGWDQPKEPVSLPLLKARLVR